jgi:hypothetical protein
VAFLILGGVSVDALTSGAREGQPIEIGRSRRAFAGNLRSSLRSIKRMWSFVTRDMTDAEITTLMTAAPHGAFVTCSGDALPGSAQYDVTYPGGTFEEAGNPYYKRSIEIRVQQV